MTTITISLPESMRTFIDKQVTKQGYGTVSEYMRALVRSDRERKAQLQLESMLIEGLESEASPMTEKDWKEIRDEVQRRQAKRKRTRA